MTENKHLWNAVNLITVVIAHSFEMGSSQFKNAPNFRLVRVILPVQKVCIGTSSF